MDDYVMITDVYENALRNLHTLSPLEQSVIASNIEKLEYLDKLLKRSKKVYQQLMNDMASDIYRKTAIVDIMQMSAILYKGKKAGLDGSRLHNAMNNNGDWLMAEQLKMMKSKK